MPVVLIIDDDPQIRDLWTDVLVEEGFDVLVASSGAHGVRLAKSKSVDVIITDVLMPEKDGIETLVEIKSALPSVRVLVVSGGGAVARTAFLDVAHRFGADATLQKPVDIDRLCFTVSQLANAA